MDQEEIKRRAHVIFAHLELRINGLALDVLARNSKQIVVLGDTKDQRVCSVMRGLFAQHGASEQQIEALSAGTMIAHQVCAPEALKRHLGTASLGIPDAFFEPTEDGYVRVLAFVLGGYGYSIDIAPRKPAGEA